MVGGTAIALHIGHRRSIDFDLFKATPFQAKKILNKIDKQGYNYLITRNVTGQLNLIINNVKFTFFEYPFSIEANEDFDKKIKIPTLLDLAAMKAFALGRRSKWKDYVDLYFIIKNHYSFNQISVRASELFNQQFSGKLFRAQLSYFDDINYEEAVEYLIPSPPCETEIKEFLIDTATNF